MKFSYFSVEALKSESKSSERDKRENQKNIAVSCHVSHDDSIMRSARCFLVAFAVESTVFLSLNPVAFR